ncbi:hypothetical protein MLD38_018807 [Melastoma candidum]|uniref:Uncharacterized protein n=1 Tax=Melastoma candidum TaxID=119954 RepID=A0ACB9QUW8_9MYRT|nr:hypothetical protein MLD38_018807 [Melastoma candidum]
MPQNCTVFGKKACLVDNSSSELFNVLHVDLEEFNLVYSLHPYAMMKFLNTEKYISTYGRGLLVRGWHVSVELKEDYDLVSVCFDYFRSFLPPVVDFCGVVCYSCYRYTAILKVSYIRIDLKPVAAMSMSRNHSPLSRT